MQAELEFGAGKPRLVAVPAHAPSPDELVEDVRRVPADARAVFARHGSLERLDAFMRHPSAAGWSPLQHLAHVVDTLHRTAMWVVAAFDEGRALGVPSHLSTRPDANRAPPRAVLGELDQASSDLADALTRLPAAMWATPVGEADEGTTLLVVLHRTVVDVAHDLVEIDTLLAART